MMNSKHIKIISTVLIMLMLLVSVTNVVFATKQETYLNTLGKDETNAQVVNIGMKIVPIVRTIGIIAAVVILMIVGIKYMMGSAEEKAEYKKTMPAYIIGAILVFGASWIITWIINLTSGLSGTVK